MSLDIRHDRGSAAAPIAQFCAVPASAATTHLKAQNGGSARDYLPGFAWFCRPVTAQRASGCL